MASTTSPHPCEGIFLALSTVLLWQYVQSLRKLSKFEIAYWSERRGRARVEKEMKRISNVQLNTSAGIFVQPIGTVHSCYRQCLGTPRQGLLAPSSRASITLSRNISPEALCGLESFSHVWITFKFHLNSNTLKETQAATAAAPAPVSAARSDDGEATDLQQVNKKKKKTQTRNRTTFNAKIALPMLKDGGLDGKTTRRQGVLATRSPHRPNPVGITLAKIRHVDKASRTVFLNACDLVEGTPVLDIKPYVPAYDTVPVGDWRVPDWIADSVHTRNTVCITPECVAAVQSLQGQLVQYKNCPLEYIAGLRETLEAEVRSKFQTKKQLEFTAKGILVPVIFDQTMVQYKWLDERSFEVVKIELLPAGVVNSLEEADPEFRKWCIDCNDQDDDNDIINNNNNNNNNNNDNNATAINEMHIDINSTTDTAKEDSITELEVTDSLGEKAEARLGLSLQKEKEFESV